MPSIDEAIQLSGGETDPEKIADVFMKKGAKNVIIKLGSKGGFMRLADEEKGNIYPIVGRSKPVDTTGAGDSFCAGFLTGLSKGLSFKDSMRFYIHI